jgi:hypothetical protein
LLLAMSKKKKLFKLLTWTARERSGTILPKPCRRAECLDLVL